MTNWYGSTPTKQQLDALLQKKPKLAELFTINQFCQELKSYNPKLLDYITNNPQLIKQAILYITVTPSLADSHDRKYKLPLLSVQMIQTETTCITNSFFKDIKQQPNTIYFDLLFDILSSIEILPLLASYLFRVNLCLLNNKFKETVQRVFKNSQWLFKLLNHSDHMPIANILQLYINLDSNKVDSRLQNKNQKLNIKIELLGKIMAKISNQSRIKTPKSLTIIENLTTILIQTIEKYYLIADGKEMMDIIISSSSIDVMIALLKESSDLAYPAMNFFISLINYYSFSSLNSEQRHNLDLSKKNLQRLENQPMVAGINSFFKPAIEKIMNNSTMSLHSYRILEVLCHMISISSYKILSTIKQTKFFQCLINLLFKFPECNILHILIQKSFLHIFISDRIIYEEYKKYLFCEMDIIDITANRFLSMFPDDKSLLQAKKKGYFGHFMRILKIYSGIQTTDEQIVNAIKGKGQIWNKISKILIKPYENTCFKQLGSYTDVPEPTPLDFKIKNDIKIQNLKPNSSYYNAIEDIRKQQQLQNMKALETTTDNTLIKRDQEHPSPLNTSGQISINHHHQHHQDLFKTPSIDFLSKNQNQAQKQPAQKKQIQNENKIQSNFADLKLESKNLSYKDWRDIEMNKSDFQKRMSVDKEQKRSNSKKKLTSPSPRKKNEWMTGSSDESDKNTKGPSVPRLDRTNSNNQRPKIPMSGNRQNNKDKQKNKNFNTSLVVDRSNNFMSQANNNSNNQNISSKINKSTLTLEQLKKIKVIQIDQPVQKKYRRMQEKDKFLLDFLGITY